MNAASYTAAGVLPAKIIKQASTVYQDGLLRPIHVQISPTNVCQLDCQFCSCANRASNVEMSLTDYTEIMQTFASYGCLAATITGGGEPTLHKDIDGILYATHEMGIDAGLVSNGLSLNRVGTEALSTLTWARISFSDDRQFINAFAKGVIDAVNRAPIDWAFSYVVTSDINYQNIASIVRMANDLNFTHVRLVTDLLDLDNVTDMDTVRETLQAMGVDDSLVIYQGRKAYTKGAKDCLISLVKPVISADGGWYPCCGIQYALDTPGLDFEPSMCMGNYPPGIIENQTPFDGSVCKRCYYDAYNVALNAICSDCEHENFI